MTSLFYQVTDVVGSRNSFIVWVFSVPLPLPVYYALAVSLHRGEKADKCGLNGFRCLFCFFFFFKN